MIRSTLLLSLLILAGDVVVLAQGGSRGEAAVDAANAAKAEFAAKNSTGGSVPTNFERGNVSRTIKVVLDAVGDDGSLVIREPRRGESLRILLQAETRLLGRDKRKIAPGDLEVGQHLKITFRPVTSEVLKVRVLKD